ncbi:hypothetical protein [Streptomyces sp. NPDC054804]
MLNYGLDLSALEGDLAVPDLVAEGGGQTWAWGPENAAQRVQGTALDFCLRVTRRRSLAETGLRAVGEDARTWLDVARVFL